MNGETKTQARRGTQGGETARATAGAGRGAVWGLLVLALVLLASWQPVLAQVGPDTPVRNAVRLDDPTHRHVADVISTVLVGVALALPCLRDRTLACVKNEALQIAVAEAAGEVTTRLAPRERPDGRDKRGWWSKHSMLACLGVLNMPANSGAFLLCPTVMIERIQADEHYATDTLGGLAAAIAVHATVHWGH